MISRNIFTVRENSWNFHCVYCPSFNKLISRNIGISISKNFITGHVKWFHGISVNSSKNYSAVFQVESTYEEGAMVYSTLYLASLIHNLTLICSPFEQVYLGHCCSLLDARYFVLPQCLVFQHCKLIFYILSTHQMKEIVSQWGDDLQIFQIYRNDNPLGNVRGLLCTILQW